MPSVVSGILGGARRQANNKAGILIGAILGDSMTDQNSRQILPPSTNPSTAWCADGYASWLRVLSRQAVRIPVANDFGVSGDTFQQMLSRLPQVLAVKPDFCIVLGGANNYAVQSYDTYLAVWLEIIKRLMKAGIIPVVLPIPPRKSGLLTAQQLASQMRFTQFQREYCRNQGIPFADYLPWVTNPAVAGNVPYDAMIRTGDTVHPSTQMAYQMGKALLRSMRDLIPYANFIYPSPADFYSADNPTGNLHGTATLHYGLMDGAIRPGASTGVTYSGGSTGGGDLATGYTFVRGGSGTLSAATVDLTKVARTDGIPYSSQAVNINAASGGTSTDEQYNVRATRNLGAGATDVVAGDWFFMEAEVEVFEAVNAWSLEAYLVEQKTGSIQTSIDLAVRDFTQGFLPNEAWSGILRTPPIQRQTDTVSYLQGNIRARLNPAASGAKLRFNVANFSIRKVDPALL